VFVECPKRIHLARAEENVSDGNLFEAGSDPRSLCIRYPDPEAVLNLAAWQESGGLCPHCGSDRVYLEKEKTRREVLSPVGPLIIEVQKCRCRVCDGSFSPSGA
jgi:hypothetical protein